MTAERDTVNGGSALPGWLRLLPSVSVLIWLAFFVGLMLTDWRVVFISADGDPAMHRRMGEVMIATRDVIRSDVFSHTRSGVEYVQMEWLSQVWLAAAGRWADWNGVAMVGALLLATAVFLLNRLLLRQGVAPLWASVAALLAGYAGAMHWLARPHLFTHVLVVMLLWQLWRFDTGKLTAGRLAVRVAGLMVLWVNLHGGFLAGLIILGLCAAGEAIRAVVVEGVERASCRRKAVVLAVMVAVGLVASLANPNTWEVHAHIAHFFLRTPELAGYTQEFSSPNFHSPGLRGFLLLLMVLGLTLMIRRPQLTPTEILLMGGWAFLSLQSARHAPIFALVTAPVLGRMWQEAAGAGGWKILHRLAVRVGRLDRATNGWGWMPVGFVAMALMTGVPYQLGRESWLRTGILESRYPVAMVTWLKNEQPVLSGEMFNEYHWGGYLMWAWPERKVFIDGRNDFYGPGLVADFDALTDGRSNWRDVLARWNVGWTILPAEHPMNQILALDAGWRLVRTDEVATVFARVGAEEVADE